MTLARGSSESELIKVYGICSLYLGLRKDNLEPWIQFSLDCTTLVDQQENIQLFSLSASYCSHFHLKAKSGSHW